MRLGLFPQLVAEVGDRLASKVASRVRRERASGGGGRLSGSQTETTNSVESTA